MILYGAPLFSFYLLLFQFHQSDCLQPALAFLVEAGTTCSITSAMPEASIHNPGVSAFPGAFTI